MSLRINHNLAAMNAHRNLVNTTEALSKSMQKLSSGYRINQGSDDPAGLVISEQFRAQIAGMNRAIENSEGSISMIQTAEGALTEINNLLVSMRELAIHAANEGFNDADQLAADQAEITNAIKTIDRIAANTQFGTKKLLDGTKENVATITSNNTSGVNLGDSNLKTGNYSLTAVKTADAAASLNTSAYGISLANTDGDPTNIGEGIHNVDVIQASDVAQKVGSSMAITDAWNNGLEVAGAATAAAVTSGGTNYSAAVATHAGTYSFSMYYQDSSAGTGQASALQTFDVNIQAGDSAATVVSAMQTAIDGSGETLANKVTVSSTDAGGGNFSFTFTTNSEGAQYSLKTEASSTTASGGLSFAAASDRGASLGVLRYTTNTYGTAGTGVITNEDVTVANATYTDMATLVGAVNTAVAAAGSYDANDLVASVGAGGNSIDIKTKDEGSLYYVKQVATAGASSDLNNVLGLSVDVQNNFGVDAQVSFDNYVNNINDVRFAQTGTYTLKSDADSSSTQATMDIVTDKASAAAGSNGITFGQMLATVTGTKLSVRLNGGSAVTATVGQQSIIYSPDREESISVNYALTSNGGNETISNTDQSLVFQIGANVGQTTRISMRNMAASSLGDGIVGNMFSSLANIDVTTAQGAQDAQSVIDAAINEVSTTRGALGSFQKNTLESNLRNLRIAAQNLTASESMIRDTDMAKEMSNFTKNQILMQAGTSMLAQANQVPQSILSLF